MLLGLNGFRGAGKDTAGEYLCKIYGFERLSFAQKLKESAAALFGIEPSLWDELKNEGGGIFLIDEHGSSLAKASYREFLQRYGTEAHRDIFGYDFWVDHALKGINPNKNYLFTDARFENELEKIRNLGGKNLRIERNLEVKDTHASEVEPPQHLIDYIIYNDGTFDDLYVQLDDFVEWLNGQLYEADYEEIEL